MCTLKAISLVAERAATILCTIEVITAAAVVNIKHNVTKNNLPVMDDSVVYETWRKEVELWQEVTDIDKQKQAVTIYFAFRGKARDACILKKIKVNYWQMMA